MLRDGKTSERQGDARGERRPRRTRGRGSEGASGEGSAKYGMTVEPLTPEIARQLELDRDTRGVVITGVDPSGAAASAGLREGDVIQQVNGKPVQHGGRGARAR